MRIFLVGGGTGGPTTPLLAVAQALQKMRPDAELFFVGNKKVLEQRLIEASGLTVTYLTIPAGKWRRYFSARNIIDLFKFVAGVIKSIYFLQKYHPDIIFGAGSFVQVPMVLAAFFFKTPSVIHQQDFELLLSTKLAAPFAKAVTVSFGYSGKEIPQSSGLFAKIPRSKIYITGNPVRRDIVSGSAGKARQIFSLSTDFPTVLVLGGGAGSEFLNKILLEALPELVRYVQVIHSTGGRISKEQIFAHLNYHPYEFLGADLKHAYAAADLVVSRAGMSTIAELSWLGKASILIPLSDSLQVRNVEVLTLLKFAVGVSEEVLTAGLLVRLVRKILWNSDIQQTMQLGIKQLMPHDSDKKIANLLIKITKEKRRTYAT